MAFILISCLVDLTFFFLFNDNWLNMKFEKSLIFFKEISIYIGYLTVIFKLVYAV